jgi:hypothetical protein
MLNINFNSLTLWDSQNPYNPKLNQKQVLRVSSKKKNNNNYQYYNILSAYEVKDENSISSTYVSLVFYHTIRSREILVKISLQVFFSEGVVLSGFAPKYPWIFRG